MSSAYDPLATDESDVKPRPKTPNQFQRIARMVYNPIGFKHAYNFVFGFILVGALLGFCFWEIRKIDVNGYWMAHATPDMLYYFTRPRYNIGMQMHLGCILPGGILAALQFIPIIRHKVIMFHRLNGWIVTLLLMVSNTGAAMIANRSMGGFYDLQVFAGVLVIFSTISAWMGVINIKRKHIDQHRKWMMRCWVYNGSIITLRFVMMASSQVVNSLRGYYVYMQCDVLEFMGGNTTAYPNCAVGGPSAFTAVEANINSQNVEEIVAGYQITFGQAGLIAFTIHAVLLEIYFHLTPAESERLRNVSYDRQLERGYKKPGSGGLTSDRLGDAPRWRPAMVKEQS